MPGGYIVDFLEEVEAGRVCTEQRGQHGKEAQRAVRRAVGRHFATIRLAEHEMDPTAGIARELEPLHVHGREFA